jgi:hypothetical protein
LARLPGAEIATYGRFQEEEVEGQAASEGRAERSGNQEVRKTLTKPARKPSSAKKVAAKKKVATRKPQRAASPPGPPRPSKGFDEKVRNCDAGTGIWFIVAGSVEHAAIQKRGSDGAVVIRTDAGATETVPMGNLFETADEARAARY